MDLREYGIRKTFNEVLPTFKYEKNKERIDLRLPTVERSSKDNCTIASLRSDAKRSNKDNCTIASLRSDATINNKDNCTIASLRSDVKRRGNLKRHDVIFTENACNNESNFNVNYSRRKHKKNGNIQQLIPLLRDIQSDQLSHAYRLSYRKKLKSNTLDESSLLRSQTSSKRKHRLGSLLPELSKLSISTTERTTGKLQRSNRVRYSIP